MRKFIALPIIASLALGGCTWSQVKTEFAVIGTDLKLVAQKVDSGYQLALYEIPAACKLTGIVAFLGQQASASGALGTQAAAKTSLASAGASALAESSLCVDPQPGDIVSTSVAIIKAVKAVKNATSLTPGATVTATTAAGS